MVNGVAKLACVEGGNTLASPWGIMCILCTPPSTDVSVDISTDTRHIDRRWAEILTEMCRSTYRPTLDRSVGRYVDREWLSDCRPTCRSIGY